MIEDASFDQLMVNSLLMIDNLKHNVIFKEWSPLFKFPEVFFPLITTVSYSYNLQNNAKRVGTEMVLMPLYWTNFLAAGQFT